MENNKRPVGDPKSFVIKWTGDKPTVDTSHWAVGYTPRHRASPADACQAELDALSKQLGEIGEKIQATKGLMYTLREDCNHDNHECKGCGWPIKHGEVACNECKADHGGNYDG